MAITSIEASKRGKPSGSKGSAKPSSKSPKATKSSKKAPQKK